jgi:hypothetical protein
VRLLVNEAALKQVFSEFLELFLANNYCFILSVSCP